MKDELFENWCKSHKLKINNFDIYNIVDIDSQKYLLLNSDKEVLIDSNFELIFDKKEMSILENQEIDFVIFRFGNYFYCCAPFTVELNLFLYVGQPDVDLLLDVPYLGIRGECELFNGVSSYSNWAHKANWLQYKTLGICELNTLGGVVYFQEECKKKGIKSIIGETLTFEIEQSNIKLIIFAKNDLGFEQLISLNNLRNRDASSLKLIDSNLICIIPVDVSFEKAHQILKKNKIEHFFQIDFSEWDADLKDKEVILNIEYYLKNKLYEKTKPILVNTSFFLEKEDIICQKQLNKIGNIGFNSTSKNHYFKDLDDIYLQILKSFDVNSLDFADKFFQDCIKNTKSLADECNVDIKLFNLYLPKYNLTSEELIKYSSEDSMIDKLIQEGLNRLNLSNDIYLERIKSELEVIREGGFVSYFLILWDIVEFCKRNDILYGLGRGSAAGCLVSYALGITQIDPLPYGLIFERFLNRGRLKKGLPDIDFDVQSEGRHKVKEYISEKYGQDKVASIGTYSTFKIRALVKDVSRQFGLEPQYMNFISSILDPTYNYTELLKKAVDDKALFEFATKNQKVIELIPKLINQKRNASIHAAAVVIVPSEKDGRNVNINNWIPTREVDGIVVTEWEGNLLGDIGFLKNDILGVLQLDKIKKTINLIRQTEGIEIDFAKIPLDSKEVYEHLQKGINEDVFQFGTHGLRKYCTMLKPERIEDLIASVALYRPGPMIVNAHTEFAQLKNGVGEVKYFEGCENITEETYGLLVYQEQCILICRDLAKFDLVTADEVRKAVAKKKKEEIFKFEDRFLEGCVNNNISLEGAKHIWETMSKFGEYSFNKSHAACYAITGYVSQWLKVFYPIEFYATSLETSSFDELDGRISEINNSSPIKLVAPDINKSTTKFEFDKKEGKIFWSLSSIKWVSEKVLEHIFVERDKNGKFFSLSEFISRVEKKVVNKRVITNLIVSGAFDSFNDFNLSFNIFRFQLLQDFYQKNKYKNEELDEFRKLKEYEWILRQKELSSYGFIDYKKIYNQTEIALNFEYLDFNSLNDDDSLLNEKISVIGLVVEKIERKSSKGPFIQLLLDINSNRFYCTIWNDTYMKYKDELDSSENKIVCITGKCIFDSWKKQNLLHSSDFSKIEVL